MKKSFRFLLVAIFTACLLAMSALAVSVEYRAEAVSGVDNAFDMYVNVKSENPVASFATRIIYNNEILQPADYEYNVADVCKGDEVTDCSLAGEGTVMDHVRQSDDGSRSVMQGKSQASRT